MNSYKPWVLLGLIAATTSSCIISDKCIHFKKKYGHKWEVTLRGIEKNPSTNEERFIVAKVRNCYDDDDNALLVDADFNDPLYLVLRNELWLLAQQQCVENSTSGFVDIRCDPFDAGDNLERIILPVEGECLVPNDSEASCPEAQGTATDGESSTTVESPTTGESSTTDSPTTTEPTPTTTESSSTETDVCDSLDLGTRITCVSNTCEVDEQLIDDLVANPSLLFCDTARLYPKEVSSVVVGMYFDHVRPSGLAGTLGFQDDDVITAVEGLPFTNEEDFAVIALELADSDEVTVTILRGLNSIDLTFDRV
ncbi:hypothetical protein [Nannocystis pusilla]|uniref:hypothetical protein n=1 Tax=Nannocystis pusilla TaxID=889268 RepID=UPI003BF220DA